MAMNIFRLTGDMLHAMSIIILLYQVHVKKHAKSISVRFIEASLMVSLVRYLDLFTTFYGLYNSCMKIFYISGDLMLIYAIKCKEEVNSTYDKARDSFPHWKYIVAPSAVASFTICLVSQGILRFDTMEWLWKLSIILESVSILPQLHLLKRYRHVEPLVDVSVFCRGIYRVFYILNWVYRSNTERHYRHHYLLYACAVVQACLYIKFYHRLFKDGILCRIAEYWFVGGPELEGAEAFDLELEQPLMEQTNEEENAEVARDQSTEHPGVDQENLIIDLDEDMPNEAQLNQEKSNAEPEEGTSEKTEQKNEEV